MIFINDEKSSISAYLKAIGVNETELFNKYEEQKKAGERVPLAFFKLKKVRFQEDGMPLFAPVQLSHQFQVNHPELGIVTVTFTNSAPRQVKNAGVRYEDPNYKINDTMTIIRPLEEREKFVLFATYPTCEQSPMAKHVNFYLDDPDKLAAKDNAHHNQIKAAYVAVDKLSTYEKQEIVASWLIGASKLTDLQLENKLYEKINTDVVAFNKTITDQNVLFAGRIQLAIEGGVLQQKTVGGVTRWHMKGSEDALCVVPNGAEAVAHIKGWLLRNPDVFTEMSALLKGTSDKDVVAKLMTEKPKGALHEKYLHLVNEGEIYFDAPNKKIKFVDDTVVAELDSVKNWRENAFELIKKDKNIKKLIEEKYDAVVVA